jgi:hypothetical protein
MQAHPSDLVFGEGCVVEPSSLLEVSGKSSVLKVNVPKVSALKVSALKVSALKVSALKVSAPKVSAPKVSAPKVSAPKVSALKVGSRALLSVAFNPKSVLIKNGFQFRRLQGFSLLPL